ncbi:hypothetical protein BC834DRAFT_898536 [Gloeopeniophorella convolvens]|nr:hypothetical protein BC834DRAFT_898536 [Gloeopeniophorella convolvens]
MMRQFDITEGALRQYISHGDSLFLANLLYFVRRSLFVSPRPINHGYLERVTEDKPILMEDTLPELQQQFCEVWNDVVDLTNRQFNDSGESSVCRYTSLEALAFMRDLFMSLHPELIHPPTLSLGNMQRLDAHDRQLHPSPDNPPLLAPNNALPPPDEGIPGAHAAPCAQRANPPVSSPSTLREPSAALLAGPASSGSGALVVDASTLSHVLGDTEPSCSSSPIAPSMVQHSKVSTLSLRHGAQDTADQSAL